MSDEELLALFSNALRPTRNLRKSDALPMLRAVAHAAFMEGAYFGNGVSWVESTDSPYRDPATS